MALQASAISTYEYRNAGDRAECSGNHGMCDEFRTAIAREKLGGKVRSSHRMCGNAPRPAAQPALDREMGCVGPQRSLHAAQHHPSLLRQSITAGCRDPSYLASHQG